MKRAARRQRNKGALEVIEEAVHWLRIAPLATLGIYYFGSLPFVLGLLYFWAEMSRSPFAHHYLAGGALGMAVLFLWMKFWQAVFARNLRSLIAGEPPPVLSFTRARRIAVTQAALQPTGLFALPLSLLPVLPVAWLFAFYQNLTALADGESAALRVLVKRARRQAALWPGQNHVLLLILFAFALCVFLNWCVVAYALPALAKMLFGIETVFTRSGVSALNTTFFAAMFGLTYLSVDPILKTVYTLRCFYGESLESGADLKAELRGCVVGASRGIAATILAVLLVGGWHAHAAEGAQAPAPGAPGPNAPVALRVSPAELDGVIEEVLLQRKYTWRMPREKIAQPETKKGILARFVERVGDMFRRAARAVFDWVDEWLRKLFARQRSPAGTGGSGYGWMVTLHLLLYALVAATVAALAILALRAWRHRHKEPAIATTPVQPIPDLADENVGADRLPEDGWTRLARELLARGELRLALRAFYLASLAHLATRNLVSLAKFKSNRDYERELRRRAHSFPELLTLFSENVSAFERIWYGTHAIDDELVNRFAGNVERIRTGA